MQATVKSYNALSGEGSVLLDDGKELPFARPALAGTGLRLLRLGQRVRILTREGQVVALTLATFALPGGGPDAS